MFNYINTIHGGAFLLSVCFVFAVDFVGVLIIVGVVGGVGAADNVV